MEIFLGSYKKQACNVTQACNAAGITRTTFYKWAKKYPAFKLKVDEIRESLIDFAEGKLLAKIKDGDLTATISFLNSQAKHRGYGKG
jgi:hypothetical protein